MDADERGWLNLRDGKGIPMADIEQEAAETTPRSRKRRPLSGTAKLLIAFIAVFIFSQIWIGLEPWVRQRRKFGTWDANAYLQLYWHNPKSITFYRNELADGVTFQEKATITEILNSLRFRGLPSPFSRAPRDGYGLIVVQEDGEEVHLNCGPDEILFDGFVFKAASTWRPMYDRLRMKLEEVRRMRVGKGEQ